MDAEVHGALKRYLEIDRLLGVREVPLSVPAPSAPGPGLSSRGDARPAGAQMSARAPFTPAARTGGTAVPARSPLPAVAGHAVAAGPRTAGDAPHVQSISAADLAARRQALDELNESAVKPCRKCGLCATRKQTVFGQGSPAARLVFVGEAPGADEDAQGLAFVGRAGQLLTRMIDAMGVTRDEVFICNILKCRPPDNRTPAPDEITACWPHLDAQLRILKPEVIVTLGKPASQTLLRTDVAISRLRGQWHEYPLSGLPGAGDSVALMPTFHPAYLLRNPAEKAKSWADLKLVMERLGWPLPKR